ncbi:uncharacterized protein LY89DRAFT_728758 [Mollisia scopiformis]|uniref:DUF6604 domain-containing protein n=1 Tax=Mollisia scopiformis TaxID=149040 RepID=A0A194XR25_MOLSC|nr:uncharacterized protein LY89DRAFT_728758 [Mollisia scopiformis]KUJ22638.1 hypothetical protein LY89DRAFT_728758 [Mollisia scopiformis]
MWGCFLAQEASTPMTEDKLRNIFEALDLDEPSFEQPPSEGVKATKPTTSTTWTLKKDEAEDEEKLLAIYCLYEDLNLLRQDIGMLWTDYRAGRSDLVSVSVATNAALEFGIYVEAEFLETYPDLTTGYKIMIALLSIFRSPGWSSTFLAVETEQIDKGCYVVVKQVLGYWLSMDALTAWTTVTSIDQMVLSAVCASNSQVYQQDVQKDIESKAADAYELRILRYKSDLFSIASEAAVHEVLHHELPVVDLVTQTLRDSIANRAGGKSLSAVFSSQAFLDIKEIMGESVSDGFNELRRFRDYLDVQRDLSSLVSSAKGSLDKMKRLIDEDICQQWKNEARSQMFHANGSRLAADSVPAPAFKLLKEHPLLCGLLLFYCQMNLQRVGMHSADSRISILACSHLYNAVQKAQLLSRQWDDLEHIFSNHSDKDFFLGSRPETLTTILRQWALVNGISTTFFSNHASKCEICTGSSHQ